MANRSTSGRSMRGLAGRGRGHRESRVIGWMTSNPSGISLQAAAVLDAYAPRLRKAPPVRQGRLLSQLIWEVRWDGRRRRLAVKLDEAAIAQGMLVSRRPATSTTKPI